ncbi:hypothetical protein OKW33_002206 [Paraburkholderia atlantica]|nr:hypothetical protein [Paraburkholderia atlantica]MPW04296.1 hypothetical protein [Paraburkholderia atlantica]
MCSVKMTAMCIILYSMSSIAIGAEVGLKGDFEGTGRACSGALYVRANTIEWNSTYSVCKPTRYEILEKNFSDDQRRIVFHLKNPGRQCRFKIVEVEHASGHNWNVSGYRSLEGFQKRDLPDWNNSPLPERQVLSCLMVERD